MSLINSIQNLNISIQYEANRSKKGFLNHMIMHLKQIKSIVNYIEAKKSEQNYLNF